MGYESYLKETLRPLRLYELEAGPGAAELSALGAAMDAAAQALSDGERESRIPSAEDAGLAGYEAILPYTPRYITLADRRRAVMALRRSDGRSFTPRALCDTLAGCGIRALAAETGTRNTVEVTFPDNRGEPENYAALRTRIEAILPCHLAVVYRLIYLTWAELESWLPDWEVLAARCPTWNALERYAGEGA